jgi:hypothetical protein
MACRDLEEAPTLLYEPVPAPASRARRVCSALLRPVLSVDDSRFEPRFLARLFPGTWFAVAGSPTRVRPNRPISFTPSRTEPLARPPWATRPPERPWATTRLAQAGVWLLIAVGWLVFATWWAIVLRRERIEALAYALGVIAAIIVACAVVMSLWTRHNIRIARKGKRGHSSLYIPMRWERDALGRPIELPALGVARTAPDVRVVLRNGVKTYVVERERKA